MQNAKKVFAGLVFLFIYKIAFLQQLKLGKNPYVVEKSAVLELQSNNQGLLFTRINDTALINMMNVPDGMVIFHIPSLQLLLRSGGSWKPLTVTAALNNYWSVAGNTGTVSGSQFIGTTDLKSFKLRTNNIQRMVVDSLGNIGIGGSPSFTSGTYREKFLVDAGTTLSYNPFVVRGSIDSFFQINIKNLSTGTHASSDVVATADNGDESSFYVNMGINGSANTSNNFGGANDAYLYNLGQNLLIGTATASKSLVFLTGGGTQATNERMRIDGTGNIGVGLTLPTAYVHLKAGTTGASTAPLKFTTGSLMTTPEAGAVEYLSDKFYGTIATGAARKEFTLNDIGLTSGRVPFAATNGRLTDLPSFTYTTNRLSPTYLTLAGGTAVAGTAPLIMTPGINLASPLNGALEFDGTHFYGTVNTNRYQLDQQNTGINTGDQTITLTGNVTGSGTGSFATTIANNVVSYSKMQQVSAARLLGNPTVGTANAAEISLGTGLSFVGSTLTYTAATSGTVVSVGLALPSIFSISGSPVTNSGTLTASLANQTANQVFAGPASGAAASPTFRSLAAADLPFATNASIGGVSIGSGLTVNGTGVLSANFSLSSLSATAPLSYNNSTGAVSIPKSTTAVDGYLSATDWTTFNNKQSALTLGNVSGTDFTFTGNSGAIIGAGLAMTLATVNSNTGVFGSGTAVPQLTVNSKGLITAVNAQPISFPVSSVNSATGAVSLGIANMNDATITTPTTNQLLQYNGTRWVNSTPSFVSSAVTSLNALTASSQTFAVPGTSGLAPGWSSATSVHTLNIPLASAAGVTAGLLSNANWTTFNNKLSSVDTSNISNFYTKTRSLLSAGSGITYNPATGLISSTVTGANLWAFNGNTVGSLKTIGTIDNYALPFIINNVERMRLTTSGQLGIGSTDFDATNPETLLIDAGTSVSNALVNATGNVNGYLQFNVQNTNNGNFASTDIVATANNGTDNSVYIDMGINSQGYTVGNSNILNGANSAYLYASASDFYVGNGAKDKPLIFFTNEGTQGDAYANGTEKMRINATGLIPGGNGTYDLGGSSNRWKQIYATNTTISTSDIREKTNVIDLRYGLKEVLALRPVRYNWKKSPDDDKMIGLIAQEVKKIVPEIVVGDETKEMLGMKYVELVPVLINAIKEQQKQIDELKQEIKRLQK